MIENKNVIVMDIDGTLCKKRKENENYLVVKPKKEILNKLKEYKDKNFYIILYTSRQMKTYKGNIGKINANTAKILFQWLDKYEVPYDEIYFGKPWCGINGVYVDDKAIRPEEFEKMDYNEILKLIGEKK